MTGRRKERLINLQKSIKTKTFIKQIDICKPNMAIELLKELIDELGGLDLIVISSGIVRPNLELSWSNEEETIATNISGFAAMANTASQYFMKQKYGHIVGISSMSSLVYSDRSNAYCASKAFVSNYLRGLRILLTKASKRIYVTEVVPGWVYTEMTKQADKSKLFWTTTADKAAEEIYTSILKKKRKIYISKRWRLLAWLINILPESFRVK
ncbi:SDR family NAD(P)-dependent oxidoreductase [Clostridium acetobutylicum]|uniref:SDR family NAD(P)-dependent oxidoreductase n=1 Tax=Clostridium acetobutylicum TaxID=1488 RepID=UPI002095739D|nr:SDR family NAD(P)-dependent oxidoreductase [Clostridium acetobutylicum]